MNFNLLYLLKYSQYVTEIFTTNWYINKKPDKVYRLGLSYTVTKKSTIFWTCVICADMPGFRRPSHICGLNLISYNYPLPFYIAIGYTSHNRHCWTYRKRKGNMTEYVYKAVAIIMLKPRAPVLFFVCSFK